MTPSSPLPPPEMQGRLGRVFDRLFGIPDHSEDFETFMKRKAREAGLDTDDFWEWCHPPPEPGSLGPDDPGRIDTERVT